jgi:hypothetical protein
MIPLAALEGIMNTSGTAALRASQASVSFRRLARAHYRKASFPATAVRGG